MSWGAKLTPAEKLSVRTVAQRLNVKPDDLMDVLAVETEISKGELTTRLDMWSKLGLQNAG